MLTRAGPPGGLVHPLETVKEKVEHENRKEEKVENERMQQQEQQQQQQQQQRTEGLTSGAPPVPRTTEIRSRAGVDDENGYFKSEPSSDTSPCAVTAAAADAAAGMERE